LFNKNVSYFLSLAVIIVVVYFFYREFKSNWEVLHNYQLSIKLNYIVISFIITSIAFLLDAYIFHICINKYIERKNISFLTSIVVLNTSNVFKYVPGLVWGYAAQILWFSKKGISKYKILYVNFVYSISAIIVAIFLGIIYSTYYFPSMIFKSGVIFLVFLILDLLFIFCNSTLTDFLLRVINRCFNKEIQILHTPKFLLISMQMIYCIQWHLVGLGGYFLAQGIGLDISFTHFYALLASMAFSWVIGYLSVITPGGLGVREGIMYLMLNHVTDVQTSLIMPIATRFLYLLVELSLGCIGFLLAVKFRIFSDPLE
jgi:uncharacterized membrane protein YbhN (UPF0104 family)